MRFFRQRNQEQSVTVTQEERLEEARSARLAAEQRLEVTQREVEVPLRDMHKVNHIQPLINQLIAGRRTQSGKPAAD
jgi:hypothetical protein